MREINYWNNKDRCIKVAKSCKDKTDFIVNHQGAYKSAVRNRWIEEINDLFTKRKDGKENI